MVVENRRLQLLRGRRNNESCRLLKHELKLCVKNNIAYKGCADFPQILCIDDG